MTEFDRINARGGVLGAMETQYQRSRIQEESLYYEELNTLESFPLSVSNTYLNPKVTDGSYVRPEIELARASYDEKDDQLRVLVSLRIAHLFKRGCLERPCQSGIGRSQSLCGAYAYRAACKPWRNLGLTVSSWRKISQENVIGCSLSG